MLFNRSNKIVFSNRVISSICFFIFLFILIYIYNTDWHDHIARDKLSVGFFPKGTLFLAIFFCVGMFFNKQGKNVPKLLKDFDHKILMVCLFGLIICWLYFIVLLMLGFILTTFLFTSLTTYFLGPKSWKSSIITSIIITFSTYGFFSLLQVELPIGTLWIWTFSLLIINKKPNW